MGERLRLDRYLSEVSKRTRKEAKALIREGKVTVNQKVIHIPEQKINLETDQIALDGHLLCYCKMEYYLLNKPAGIVSASRDKREKTVVDLIQDRKREDLFPVGRLDKDTEGLLLITNDGVLAHQLLSPKRHIDKVYFAKIKGKVDTEDQKKFQEGLTVDEEFTAMPAKLDILRVWQEDNDFYSEIHLTIRKISSSKEDVFGSRERSFIFKTNCNGIYLSARNVKVGKLSGTDRTRDRTIKRRSF